MLDKNYLKLNYGSSVYGLTNPLSDIDYMVLLLKPEIPLDFDVPEDVDVWTVEQFVKKIKEHDLKALEVYYYYFDFFYNQLEIDHTLVLDTLRRSVSATCSNSFVKAKKKILQGDTYLGLKSYFHCIRILTMFIALAKYKHFDPSKFKDVLEEDYNTIMEYIDTTLDAHHIIALLNNGHGFKNKLNALRSEFKLVCPFAQ